MIMLSDTSVSESSQGGSISIKETFPLYMDTRLYLQKSSDNHYQLLLDFLDNQRVEVECFCAQISSRLVVYLLNEGVLKVTSESGKRISAPISGVDFNGQGRPDFIKELAHV